MAKDMKHLLKELRAQRDNRTLDDGFDDDEDFDDDGVEVIYVRIDGCSSIPSGAYRPRSCSDDYARINGVSPPPLANSTSVTRRLICATM